MPHWLFVQKTFFLLRYFHYLALVRSLHYLSCLGSPDVKMSSVLPCIETRIVQFLTIPMSIVINPPNRTFLFKRLCFLCKTFFFLLDLLNLATMHMLSLGCKRVLMIRQTYMLKFSDVHCEILLEWKCRTSSHEAACATCCY